MPTYIAFLRAINLGANRKFPKDAIKAAAEGAGFTDVETYINTGNVRVTTRLRSRAKVEAALEKAFLDGPRLRGADHRVHAGGADGDRRGGDGVREGPRRACTTSRCSRTSPPRQLIEKIEAAGTGEESARVGGRAVHLLLGRELPRGQAEQRRRREADGRRDQPQPQGDPDPRREVGRLGALVTRRGTPASASPRTRASPRRRRRCAAAGSGRSARARGRPRAGRAWRR